MPKADHLKLAADDRIALIRAKIHRAKKHFADLEIEAAEWADKYRDVLLGKKNPKTGEIARPYEHRRLPMVSADTLLIAGDVIHNVRSALDHLMWHLALVGSPGIDPGRIEFPIAKDQATYETNRATKVKGLSPEAVEAIDRLKPYHGGTEAFWRIHELDIIDKHRVILTIERDVILVGDWYPGDGTYLLKTDDPHFSGLQMSDVEKDIYLRPSEAFGDPKILQRNALIPTIKELVYFVDELIVTFKPFLVPPQ